MTYESSLQKPVARYPAGKSKFARKDGGSRKQAQTDQPIPAAKTRASDSQPTEVDGQAGGKQLQVQQPDLGDCGPAPHSSSEVGLRLESISAELEELHDQAIANDQKGLALALKQGRLLREVQGYLKRDFRKWVPTNCKFDYRQAQRYLDLANYFESLPPEVQAECTSMRQANAAIDKVKRAKKANTTSTDAKPKLPPMSRRRISDYPIIQRHPFVVEELRQLQEDFDQHVRRFEEFLASEGLTEAKLRVLLANELRDPEHSSGSHPL